MSCSYGVQRGVRSSVAMFLTLALSAAAYANVVNVPADQPTIQAGINAAVNGDEVVVAPGTYNEIIDLSGKAITVRSSGGAAVTTIDATGVPDPGDGVPVVRIDNGEGADTVIEGFTITGGTGDTATLSGTPVGGGMYNGVGVSPTVNNCIFTANAAGAGGGMFNNQASPTITGCTFTGNTANLGGGLLSNQSGSPVITACDFLENHAVNSGGGLYHLADDLTLDRCSFVANTANEDCGGCCFSGPAVLTMTNCRVIGNVAGGRRGGVYVFSAEAGSVLLNCAIIGNVANGGAGVAGM